MDQRHDPSTTALIHHAYVPYAGFEVPQPPACKGKLESDPNSLTPILMFLATITGPWFLVSPKIERRSDCVE